ncbi:MAG: FAD-dependent oxidoreductase [Pseudomonadota bacterium]|nr:FAD-dependent oxidoreductase [Pseudomonadota bacterium]
MSEPRIVIVGAGHAGVQAAASLREDGFAGAIALLCDEHELPYQRPPLSKAFLKGQMDLSGLPLRAEKFFDEHRIDLRLGVAEVRIDRARRRVEQAGGGGEPYDHLILATGARARALRAPGLDLAGVHGLRSIRDAAAIKAALAQAGQVVVIGAGFIGLEIAATARGMGREVTIVEIADRPMGRAISPAMSAFFLDAHQGFGARFELGLGVAALHGERGRVAQVELADGRRLPADLVIVGVGVTAEDALALEAGLDCADGIVVDEQLVASDPAISAIGDCARFPHPGFAAPLRLESVQNATDQAKCVARRLTGKPERYDALPWFWSDQGDLKLQIAGLAHGADRFVTRGAPESRAFSVFAFQGERLLAVETVNRGGDHMAARRILAAGTPLTPAQAADESLDLRKLALGK